MGTIPVAAEPASPGTFAAPVSFLAGAGGPVRIEVRDVNEADGSLFASTTVQVLFTGGGTR